jgi:hypothetical protein
MITVAAGSACWRSSGQLYFEVEVCVAEGDVLIGLAGSNFRDNMVGYEPSGTSWGIYKDGNLYYRRAIPCL